MYIKPFMQKRIYVHVQTYDCEVKQTQLYYFERIRVEIRSIRKNERKFCLP